MDVENDDSMFIDPEILKKELVISLPILTESDVEMILNGVDPFDDASSLDEDDKEKPCLKRDQRRLNLLNNPDYGVILCFIEKFRSYIKMKNYPLRILEDNLINEQEKLSGRFIDFHLALLKKVSTGKTIKREQFVSCITKFAYRFNRDDGNYLDEHGYSKSTVEVKLRVLKNLLEKQFDCDQTLKNFAANKSSIEIRSKPFGRDRFGASYWLFTDTNCFIRLFRENIDNKHTWINLAKNQSELENLIKLLITDHVVRKKFPEWKFSYESFNCLSSSNEFEERYSLNLSDNKHKNELIDELCSSLVLFHSDIIKTEDVDFEPVVNLNRDLPSSPSISSPFKTDNIEKKNDIDITSDNESPNSSEIKPNRLSISSVNDTRDQIYSSDFSQDSIYNNTNYCYKYEDIENTIEKFQDQHVTSKNDDDSVPAVILKSSLEQGIKRKLVDYDDSESDIEDNEKHDDASQDSHHIPTKKDSTNNTDLPIALRRSRRGRKPFIAELSPTSSSTSKSASRSSRRKKSVNERWKSPSQTFKTNGRRQRNRRRGKTLMDENSSSTSDEHQLYNDDDLSDDYLPDKTEIDILLNGDLLEEEDDDDDYISHRQAKTVAQCHEQFQRPLTACSICLQSYRPESLLLCEDCDNAYHLECLNPELLSIPNDIWYCPLCEHKRLCDGLIEKLLILIKDQEEYEMKRRLYVSKRRKRLTNVAVNLERYVKQSTNEHQRNGIISSDDDEEEEEKEKEEINEKKTDSANNNNNINKNDDDDDDDSVYGRKNDENRKPSDQKQEQEQEQTGKRRVRSCRRKAKNYSFDDYDKKIKEAMIDAGVNKELVEDDSDDSDEIILKRRQPKKRRRYEFDDDFDASDSKKNDEYLPSRRRTINDDSRSNTRDNDSFLSNHRLTVNDDSRSARDYDDFVPNRQPTINDDSRSDARDYDDNDDFGMSDDDKAWRNRQQPSTSSKPKKKTKTKSNRNNQRKSTIRSDEDSILSEANLNNLRPEIKIKTEPTIEYDKNIIGSNEIARNVFDKRPVVNNSFDKTPTVNNSVNTTVDKTPVVENATNKNEAAKTPKPRRPRRAAAKKKKTLIQQENISDEEDNGHPAEPARRPYKRRRVSNESSVDEDDDYEKLAHKRRLFSQGKGTTRTSITSHIKKLVGDEDDDEEQEENEEDATKDKSSDGTKKDGNNNSKQKNKKTVYDEYQISDDDDFPDEQEILKTTGLNLKQPLNIPKAAPLRAPCMPSMQSYQFTMADPTANFDLTCLPETPITEPSDSNQANGN